MKEIVTIEYPVQIKKNRIHRFFIEPMSIYLLGEEIEQQYSFNSDINRIAFFESPYDNCILIITTKFNVRYTIWKTIKDAKYALRHETIIAYSVTINGKKEYIICGEDDDIEDVRIQLVKLTHIDEENNDIITAKFKEPIKGEKEHNFLFSLSDSYYDSEMIDSSYDFNKDFNKIAVVKTSLYPKVVLITQTFKLMLTNWDTPEEAYDKIGYDDLQAHYCHVGIDERPIALVADADEDIEDVYLPIPNITPLDGLKGSKASCCFTKPDYFEEGTQFCEKINQLRRPSFSKIRDLSTAFYNELTEQRKDKLFRIINHGMKILTTEEQLHAYMYYYGKMHDAKMQYALNEIPTDFFEKNKSIEIVDYACGQGIATICLCDFLKSEDYSTTIKRISLIDPSTKALSRAALLCHKYLPETEITTIKKTFDDMRMDDIPKTRLKRIHLLSNILDMDCYDLNHLGNIINKIKNNGDIFVCVDPWYHDRNLDGRQNKLMRLLKGKRIFHESLNRNQLVSNKSWTAYITIFKV